MSQIIEKPFLDDIRQEHLKHVKAIVRTKYGSPDVLHVKEVEKPIPNEVRGVLVKIYAASANPLDWHSMRGHRSWPAPRKACADRKIQGLALTLLVE